MSSSDADVAPAIAEKLELLPASPGVYLMKNARGDVIYIGKALNLRNRVRSYFTGSAADNHLASHVLRSAAYDMEWIVTANEAEALILEANLAKRHAPRYNVELKDDKHYPYIRVTVSDTFPRLVVTRHAERNQDLTFGPFTSAKAMRKTIQFLNRVFRLRDCELKLPLAEPVRPCLSYHLGRCDAPCAHLIDAGAYRKLVDEAVLLLRGRRHELQATLEGSMRRAAAEQRFEAAARLRDQLRDLETVQERQRVDLGADQEPRDLIAAQRLGKIGSVVVLEVREGFLTDRKHFEVHAPLDQDESAILTGFLKVYYLDRNPGAIPREILLSHAPVEEENMEALLRQIRGAPVTLEIPQRGEKHQQMRLATANAGVQLTEYIARRERRNRQDYRVTALQEDLGLPSPPQHIEGFDISHLSGTDTVASLVVFENGRPAKKQYRHFNVKTVEGIDDFASMREVVGRRLRRLREENQPRPDLILIDGGKGQLRAACEALLETGAEEVPILGLAKRLEEVFLPQQPEAVLVAQNLGGAASPATGTRRSPSLRHHFSTQQTPRASHRLLARRNSGCGGKDQDEIVAGLQVTNPVTSGLARRADARGGQGLGQKSCGCRRRSRSRRKLTPFPGFLGVPSASASGVIHLRFAHPGVERGILQ